VPKVLSPASSYPRKASAVPRRHPQQHLLSSLARDSFRERAAHQTHLLLAAIPDIYGLLVRSIGQVEVQYVHTLHLATDGGLCLLNFIGCK
jgi:hypothetical protein